MINLRFNRDIKVSASSRDEIVKRDRKSRAKKIDKSKISAFRNSSMRKKSSALESESERESNSQSVQFESQSQRFVIDSSTIVSATIDNATLMTMLLQLLSSSFDANSFSINSITTFVASVIVSIATLEMIEVANDSNIDDLDVLLKKYDRAQTKLLRNDLDAHDQNRVQEKTQIYVNVSSFRSSVLARFTRVASSDSRISRISTKRRFKILIVSKTEKFSRDSRDVMNDDDDEASNVNDDNRSNCIRCCRISIDCRRIANIACDKCFKQKAACISIRFEFVR
jgi:DNA-binding transcriptional regulator YbjK